MNSAVSDPRTSISGFAAIIITAVGLTLNVIAPDIPNSIMTAWGAVLMYGVRLGEIWYDRKSVSVPKDSTPAEVKDILKEAN